MNLRELNYILIPKSAGSWERWAESRTGRIVQPFFEVLGSATTEGQIAFVAMLITGAAGIDVRYSQLYLVFSGLFGLLVSALLLRPLGMIRAHELRVTAEHPACVVAGEPLTITIVLNNTGARPLYALRVSGPFMPWDGSYVGPRPSLDVLELGGVARLPVVTRFLVRGARSIGPFNVGSVRPLGLARGNRRPSPPLRFVVLPRVIPVVDMPLPPWRFVSFGAPQAAMGGESFELLGVRPYRAGDRPRDLHARAWARHGEPIVREMRQESHRRAGVLVDLTATTRRETIDLALGLAAGMVQFLVAQQVVVDLCVLGVRASTLVVGDRAAPVAAAWEMLALVEAGAPADASQADLGQFGVTGWSAANVVVAHGASPDPYVRLEGLRHLPLEIRSCAVRERARGERPPVDHVFEEAALAASTGVTL